MTLLLLPQPELLMVRGIGLSSRDCVPQDHIRAMFWELTAPSEFGENMQTVKKWNRYWLAFAGFAVAGLVVLGIFLAPSHFHSPATAGDKPAHKPAPPTPPAELAPGTTDTLIIQESTVQSMRLTAQAVHEVTAEMTLRLTGRLMIDPNRLVHVHTRFSGEIVRIGETSGDSPRPLRMGDPVVKDQLLAVVWSKEVGEKKSDLVDALSQLALHETIYKNLKSLQNTGAVPQRSIDEMQRNYESDLIEVERLQRTLRSWRIDEQELQECAAEAKRIHSHASLPPGEDLGGLPPDRKIESRWAEIDVRAPFDGTILEKNFAVGDIVGTEEDLYKIADLSRLLVMANIYEDDLPTLLSLPPALRRWKIRRSGGLGTPPIQGTIESIGNVIDPNQHTAITWGHISNPDGELRVGQFVEASIVIPTSPDWVELSPQALVDAGDHVYVFIALNNALTKVQRREVHLKRRTSKSVFASLSGEFGLQPGMRLLTRGVMELSAVLDELQSSLPQPPQ